MSKLDLTPTVTVSFHGEGDVAHIVRTSPELSRTAWEICSAYTDAKIRVDVAPRLMDSQPVEWVVSAASSKGRQTALLTQRKPAGHVFVTAA